MKNLHSIISTNNNVSRNGCSISSLVKVVYIPKEFFRHAASLRQAFAHCAIFSAAASRRSKVRIAVPLVGNTLSGPLLVNALVSHYLTNKLIRRAPFRAPIPKGIVYRTLFIKYSDYQCLLFLSKGYH